MSDALPVTQPESITGVRRESVFVKNHTFLIERPADSDRMLEHPRPYRVVYRLWTCGSQRLTVWGDPGYAARFARSTARRRYSSRERG